MPEATLIKETLPISAQWGLLGILLALALAAIVYLVVRSFRVDHARAAEMAAVQKLHGEEIAALHKSCAAEIAALHAKHEAALAGFAETRAIYVERVSAQIVMLAEVAKTFDRKGARG